MTVFSNLIARFFRQQIRNFLNLEIKICHEAKDHFENIDLPKKHLHHKRKVGYMPLLADRLVVNAGYIFLSKLIPASKFLRIDVR